MFENKNVLVAGAGDGEMISTLVSRGVTVRGFDISSMYTDQRIVYGDIKNPNIMNEMEDRFDISFDMVITENLLQVIKNPESVIENISDYERMHITYDESLMKTDPEAFWVITNHEIQRRNHQRNR